MPNWNFGTGYGIASSDIPKIFDRFYRIRPAASEDGACGLDYCSATFVALRWLNFR